MVKGYVKQWDTGTPTPFISSILLLNNLSFMMMGVLKEPSFPQNYVVAHCTTSMMATASILIFCSISLCLFPADEFPYFIQVDSWAEVLGPV